MVVIYDCINVSPMRFFGSMTQPGISGESKATAPKDFSPVAMMIITNCVDGWNAAPVDLVNIPLFTGFYTSQVVQDFFHQQSQLCHEFEAFHSCLDAFFFQRILVHFCKSVGEPLVHEHGNSQATISNNSMSFLVILYEIVRFSIVMWAM